MRRHRPNHPHEAAVPDLRYASAYVSHFITAILSSINSCVLGDQLLVKLHSLANVSAGEFASALPNQFGIAAFVIAKAAGGRLAPLSWHGAR
jgi:hypothetical protein